MATISIEVEELRTLSENLHRAKYEAERCAAIALVLQERLDGDDKTTTEFYLSAILVEGDSGFPAICAAAKYLDTLKESIV